MFNFDKSPLYTTFRHTDTKRSTHLPEGHDSVHMVGTQVPDESGQHMLSDCVVPCGPTITNKQLDGLSLMYSEYIVYDQDRIQLMYIIHCE